MPRRGEEQDWCAPAAMRLADSTRCPRRCLLYLSRLGRVGVHPEMLHRDAAALRHELVDTPAVLAGGSFALSSFMSYVAFGTIDWRPVAICALSDYIAIGLDHYLEHRAVARADDALPVRSSTVFRVAKGLLAASAVLLLAVLLSCPPRTWFEIAVCFGPAFVWDVDVSRYVRRWVGTSPVSGTASSDAKGTRRRIWSVKRIPGVKALLVGFIRVYGTYAIIRSCMDPSSPSAQSHSDAWTRAQFFLWSVVDRTCHAVMEDIRDFPDDLRNGIPTIPVLLHSVSRSKWVLSFIHTITFMAYHHNPYIALSTVYAVALVWLLDHRSSRALYHLSYHSQTIAFAAYGLQQLYSRM
ncbi:hypothetical protein DAEQUDRAFT_729759 [Daedalea quercina L-15889]|uniref:Uncharacterized protein n=1 Tax=Daedalea quercina L-15889 TaxID=1314783 RepID=A0A165NGV4_9APHY|nr:hypothetical protein DAEQUDRAFT_729759 [Daedalea quercina L-15889]